MHSEKLNQSRTFIDFNISLNLNITNNRINTNVPLSIEIIKRNLAENRMN